MTLLLILSHLLTAAIGALLFAAYVAFLHAAATWSDDDDDRDRPTDLPTPTDPPTAWKRLPIPDPASATSTYTSAPAGAQVVFAPTDTQNNPPVGIPSAAPPLASSGPPASSAPPSSAPDAKRPRATAILFDGPADGLALVTDPTSPVTLQTPHGRHRYVPTDRFDLNRRVFLHIGRIADPSIS